jgi:hypothetical protein
MRYGNGISLRSPSDVLVFTRHVGVTAMDWIEKLTGWNPDGGDGSAETAIVLVALILLAAVIIWRIPSLRTQLRSLFVAWKPK